MHSLSGIATIKKYIDSSTTTSVIGMPGVGISLFLRNLVAHNFAHFIYIEVFGMPNLTSKELFRNILLHLGDKTEYKTEKEILTKCKEKLETLSRKDKKIVLCFGGFDHLKNEYTTEFFHQLRALRNANPEKIIFIFGICRRLESLLSDELMDIDLLMLSSRYYLKPYSHKDSRALLSVYPPPNDISDAELKKVFHLSGGHFQFLQLLLRMERLHDPITDPFIRLAFTNIYNHLTYPQKKILQKVALEGKYAKKDDYLTKTGLIIEDNNTYKLFSPLFAECIKSHSSVKLPAKEAKLFSLLKKNVGKIITKDEIFETVWKENMEIASDWALDSLIYRLRNNASFKRSGYIIENHKKLGYMLIKL